MERLELCSAMLDHIEELLGLAREVITCLTHEKKLLLEESAVDKRFAPAVNEVIERMTPDVEKKQYKMYELLDQAHNDEALNN